MGTWRPWRTLRDRCDISFALVVLPPACGGGVCVEYADGHHVILIDRSLSPVDRLAVLAHELVHIERGGVAGCLDVGKEERAVDGIVAERLVPVDDLEVLVDALVELEGGVTVEMVAIEFEVPPVVARRAMVKLAERRRRAG
jgi:hypothetical protein